MKKTLTLIFSSLLAASVVAAQITGEFGRKMAYHTSGGVFASLVKALLGIGVLIIVWLWVIKLWREVFRGKKK